jgi:hypothetical protein
MSSLTRNVHRSPTHDLGATLSVEIDRPGSTWVSDLTNILAELETHRRW